MVYETVISCCGVCAYCCNLTVCVCLFMLVFFNKASVCIKHALSIRLILYPSSHHLDMLRVILAAKLRDWYGWLRHIMM